MLEVADTTASEWPVADSVDELLTRATVREPFAHADGKSGVPMERVVIGGERFVVKHLHLEGDWIMRATGDLRSRPLLVWESGILGRVPASIDHAFVGAARDNGGAAILMRDVSAWLVPEGDDPLEPEQHRRFMDHLAEFHATFWGWEDDIGLAPLANRYTAFSNEVTECERALRSGAAVPEIAAQGWQRFPAAAPRAASLVRTLQREPGLLVGALETTPQTFLHGDWKLGNLGSHPDGRTILLDWAVPGRGPGCAELAWYLAVNRRRLPIGHSKEDAIAAYRAALERHGIDTSAWWDRQLGLSLLGGLVQFGWEKAFDEPEEVRWWEERALESARYLT
jgi:Phosphotransferase enzyme family